MTDLDKSRIDIVTVVYEPEVMLLKLQARSIRMFFRPRDIGTIFIVVNEMAPEATYSLIKTQVSTEYGELAKHVQIIPAYYLGRPRIDVGGWRTQQSLKLLISKKVSTAEYLLLDAKNHFLRPVSRRNFIDLETGLLKSFKVEKHGSLGDYLNNSLNYFGLSQRSYSLPATTPYVMSTSIVRDLIEYVETKEGTKFDDFMHSKDGPNVTEFFIYYAFIEFKMGGIEKHYQLGKRNTVSLFTRFPSEPEQISSSMKAAEDKRTICFGLHKNRILNMDADLKDKIIALWSNSGLFSSTEAAEDYFRNLEINAKGKSHSIHQNGEHLSL